MTKFLRRTTRVLTTIVAIVILLLLTVVLLSQTSLVRNFVLRQIKNEVETATNATLTADGLEGNLFSGFVMRNVHLRMHLGNALDTTELITADALVSRYSLFRYIRHDEFGITSLQFQSPVVRFVKLKGDSLWNFQRFLKPTLPNQPTSKFSLVIDLQSLRISNGTLVARDYNKTRDSAAFPMRDGVRAIDWANIKATGLSLDASMFIRGDNAQSARINDLTLHEQNSGITLDRLSLSAYRDSLQTRISLGRITTKSSDIRFAASLAPFSFGGDSTYSIKSAATTLQLSAPVVNTNELAAFIPSLKTLGGSPGLDIKASGTFGNLHLEHLTLDMKGKGLINISGYLRDMQQPENFTMDLNLNARDLEDASLKYYLPGIYKGNFQSAGKIAIRSMHFAGKPLFFTDAFNIETSHGTLIGNAQLDFREKRRLYKLDVNTSHLDLGSLLNKPSLSSDLNVVLKMNGNGTDYRTLSSSFGLTTTAPSRYGTNSIQSLDVAGMIHAGTVTTNHLVATIAGGPNIAITHGTYDFTRNPQSYAVTGSATNLPLARYVKAFNTSAARLAVNLDFQGEGLDFERISGTADARISHLSLEGERFDDINASLSIARAGGDTGRIFSLRSTLADLDLSGEFGVTDLTEDLPLRFAILDSAIKNKYFPDMEASQVVAEAFAPKTCDTIQMNFDLKLKDLRPLSALMPSMMLLAHGELSGAVNGCIDHDLNMYAKGSFSSFTLRTRRLNSDTGIYIAQASRDSGSSAFDTTEITVLADSTLPSFPRVQLTPTKFNIAIEHLGLDPHTALRNLHADFSLDADSAVRFENLLLFNPHARISYTDRSAKYNVGATFDQNYAVHAAGSAAFGGRTFAPRSNLPNALANSDAEEFLSTLDTLSLVVHGRYKWFNESATKVSLRSDGRFKLDTLSIIHLEPGDVKGVFTERVRVAADLMRDSIISAFVSVPSFRLNELSRFFRTRAVAMRFADLDGKVQQLDLNMRGTLEQPQFDAALRIDHLRYSSMVFDTCEAQLHFKNETLFGNMIMHVDSAQFAVSNAGDQRALAGLSSNNKLLITIDSIPALIAIKHGPNYSADSATITSRKLSARLETNHFPIDLAATFLPAVDQLSGFGDIALSLSGTQDHIVLGGAAKLRDGAMRLQATNLYYSFDGNLSFADQTLHLDSLAIRNSPDDDPSGQALISGSLKFRGFSLDSFNVGVRTRRLTVLTPSSRSTLHTIYGPLAISTMNEPLLFAGPAQSPLLSGRIAILQSFLTISQQQQASGASSTDGIIYKAYTVTKPSGLFNGLADSNRRVLVTKEDSAQINEMLFPSRSQDIYLADSVESPLDSTARAQSAEANDNTGPSFMDRMRYDLVVDIPSDAWFIVPMPQLVGEQLRADLRTDAPLRVQRGYDHQYHITGALALTENSSYSFYKTFSPATGTVTFYDDPTNPVINIVAEYTGSHGDKGAEVKIRLLVSGKLSKPVLTMEIYRRDNSSSDFVKDSRTNQDDIREDALYFLVTGSFKSELGTGEAVNAIGKMSGALPASLASSMLNNVLGETVFKNLIRSVSLDYAGNASRVKLTAGYRDLVFRYGQTGVGSSALDADYSVEVPFSFFMNFVGSKYFVLDFDYHPLQNQSLETLQQPSYSAKFLWRYPF